MQHEDRVRLQHMLDAGQEALAFAGNRERNDLYQDRMLLLALVKCIEIIGEAAGRVSDDVCADAPDIPANEIYEFVCIETIYFLLHHTVSKLLNCMVKVPRPWVAERRAVE